MGDVTSNECPFFPDDPFQWTYTFTWTSVMLFICFTVSKLSNRYKSQKNGRKDNHYYTLYYSAKKKIKKIKIKDFSEVIKITKKLSEKTFKTWKLFLNIYYWIYFFEFWDR